MWMMVQIFYCGLSPSLCTLVNPVLGGSFFQKTKEEAHAILEELSYNNDQCPAERRIMKKDPVTLEMELLKAFATQFFDLTKPSTANKHWPIPSTPYKPRDAHMGQTVDI